MRLWKKLRNPKEVEKLHRHAHEEVDSGPVALFYDVDLIGTGNDPVIKEHADGSISIHAKLPPGSHVALLGCRITGQNIAYEVGDLSWLLPADSMLNLPLDKRQKLC